MNQSDDNSAKTVARRICRDCGLRLSLQRQLDSRGRVFQAFDRHAKLQRCIRILDFSDHTRQRLETMRRVDDHEQIVPGIVEVRRAKEKLVVVSKWIEGHSLRHYLRATDAKRHAGISLHQSLVMFSVFANHLSSLHQSGFVIHGDIKPENILISKRRTWRMILVDFGSSWNAERTIGRHEGDGITPVYAAPECQVEHGKKANFLSDQFSASVVLYEMLTGEIPYDRLGGTVGMKSIALQKPSRLLRDDAPYPKQLLKKVDSLVCQGLSLEPEKRFTGNRDWQNAAYGAVKLLPPTFSQEPTGLRWVERLQSFWRKT